MDNFKLPAYPLPIALHNNGTLNTTLDVDGASVGFTKLEKASIMIAQGMVEKYWSKDLDNDKLIPAFSRLCAKIATAVLEEANK